MNEVNEAAPTSIWCAGLPSQTERSLSEQEIAAMKIEQKHASRKTRMYLLYIPLFAIGFALIVFVIGSISDDQQSTLKGSALLVVMLVALGWPILLLPAKDHYIFNKGIKKDLQIGMVHRFEGTLDPRLYDIPSITALRKYRLIDKNEAGPISIEVLEGSGIVMSINGKQILEKRVRADIVEVATPPDFARLAAKYVQPTDDPLIARHQRNMTEAENAELQKHYRKTFSHGSVIWTLFLVFIGPVILLVRLLRGAPLNEVGLNIILSFLAALSIKRLISALKVALNIKRDLQGGFVFIEQRLEPGSSNQASYEYLPVSMLLWTENYSPAAWRTY